jgi:hypothetical protein
MPELLLSARPPNFISLYPVISRSLLTTCLKPLLLHTLHRLRRSSLQDLEGGTVVISLHIFRVTKELPLLPKKGRLPPKFLRSLLLQQSPHLLRRQPRPHHSRSIHLRPSHLMVHMTIRPQLLLLLPQVPLLSKLVRQRALPLLKIHRHSRRLGLEEIKVIPSHRALRPHKINHHQRRP